MEHTKKFSKLNEKISWVSQLVFVVATNAEHAFTLLDPKVSAYDAQRLDDLFAEVKSRHFICSC